jgi:hypothetical protein
MRARVVAAGRGARWLAEGWAMFRAAPLGWLGLSFAYVFITQLLALVPLAGPAAAAVLVPVFTVGLMGAARAASRGASVSLPMLFDAFRHGLRPQLLLGAVYAACLLAVLAGAALAVGEGAFGATIAGEAEGEVDRWQLASLIAVLLALYAPVMMLFWFAPPLVAWHSTPVAKALFFSFFAFLINWRAFLVYGAVTAAVVVLLPLVALNAMGAVAGPPTRAAANGTVLSLILLLMPTLFASFYASYRDVFGTPEEAA